jgi:hypothetical protein
MKPDTFPTRTIDEDAEPGIFIAVVSANSEQYSIRTVESTTFEVV